MANRRKSLRTFVKSAKPQIGAYMIDRLMHHGEAILIQGESYRTKDGTEE
jgi:DNA replication protein DnaC